MGGSVAPVYRHRKRYQFRRRPDPRPEWADRHPALQAAELGAGQPRHVRRLSRTRRARGAGPQCARRAGRRHRADAAQSLQGSPPRHARDLPARGPRATKSHHPRREPRRSHPVRRRPRQRRLLSRPRERPEDRIGGRDRDQRRRLQQSRDPAALRHRPGRMAASRSGSTSSPTFRWGRTSPIIRAFR